MKYEIINLHSRSIFSAICLRACENGGRCAKPNKCECNTGFYGDTCQHRVGKLMWLSIWLERYKLMYFGVPLCDTMGHCLNCTHVILYFSDVIKNCSVYMWRWFIYYVTGLCSVPCKNKGVCTKENKCECPTGYMGQFCQIRTYNINAKIL